MQTFSRIGHVRTRALGGVHDMAFIETLPHVRPSSIIRYTTPTINQQATLMRAFQGSIWKSGYRTRATYGAISNASATVNMNFANVGLPRMQLHDLIKSNNVVNEGDSGGIVFDPNGNVFGVTVGFDANTRTMWTTKAYNIFRDFGIMPALPTHIPGDVNGDGRVNGTDVFLLRLFLAGFPVNIDLAAADVNRDGRVNGTDVMLIRLFLAGFPVNLLSDDAIAADTHAQIAPMQLAQTRVSASSVSGRRGSTVDVVVRVDSNPGLAGLQFALDYDPRALEVVGVRSANHALALTGPNIAARPLPLLFEEANLHNSTSTGNLAIVTFRINNTAPTGSQRITVIPEAAANVNSARSPVLVSSPIAVTHGTINVTP